MSINRGIEKEVVVHIHSGILEGNTSESVLVKWLNIELVIQNEVSQKEKNKSLVLMHIYMESTFCRAEIEMQTSRTDVGPSRERRGCHELREKN